MISHPLAGIASLLTALVVAALVGWLVPPTRRLAGRVRPYTTAARSAAVPLEAHPHLPLPAVAARLFGPILSAAARRLSRLLDGSAEDELALRIRQAGLYPDLAEEERLGAYRLQQLGNVTAFTGAAAALAVALRMPAGRGLLLAALGLVVGASRQRGRLQRALATRRERMRIEVYTVNQLLALRVRAGGSVMHAVGQLVVAGQGEVVTELGEVLRLHRSGMRAAEAFARQADLTPEPFCARTYHLLATADERGIDLAAGLLALSEDVREARREAIRRAATRRRAAMLVPIIAVLAPVMLLFVGAPLPFVVLGWR